MDVEWNWKSLAVLVVFTVIVGTVVAVATARYGSASVAKRKTVSSFLKHASKLSSESNGDVWAERRRRGISVSSSNQSVTSAASVTSKKEKPFGSTYYYAHNNNSKGGYKDGLKLEDYTMNGPRLLSRDGKSVDEFKMSENVQDPPAPQSSIKHRKRIIPLQKYLWDDPGDTKGVASILIDSLPRSSTEMVPWNQVTVTDITTSLENNGLLVIIHTDSEEYRLGIPTLYGRVEKVQAIPKTKRLVIKLYKVGGLWNKSNLRSWPHPHKKIVD